MAKLTTEEFIAAIKELSVLELNDLVKACEEEFGVSAAAGVVVAAAGAAEAGAGAAAPPLRRAGGAGGHLQPGAGKHVPGAGADQGSASGHPAAGKGPE